MATLILKLRTLALVTLPLVLVPALAGAAFPAALPVGALSGKVIAIDPGHGGDDPGAINYYEAHGLACPYVQCPNEGEVNLRIGLAVAALLESQGATVVLTRSGDDSVSLADRVTMANDADANIFVSVHQNACCNGHGTESFYYGSATSWSANGKRLALDVQDGVTSSVGLTDRGIHADQAYLGYHLYVLRYTRMPAALVEVSFIDSKADYDQMILPQNDVLAAQGIVDGIDAYFG